MSMGAKHSCAKRVEETGREHRTFDLLVPSGVSEGHEPCPYPYPNPIPGLCPYHGPEPEPRAPSRARALAQR